MATQSRKYQWFAIGDVNGFFGLMFDNLTVLSFLAGILVFAFEFPAEIVYTRMFPGTAFGVLFGDLVYTWMAFRLARRTGNTKVTAMPLGLDTPSTIGIALVVLGPAFVSLKAQGMDRAGGGDADLVHRHGDHGPDRRSSSWCCRSAAAGCRRWCPRPACSAPWPASASPSSASSRSSTSSACRWSAWSRSASSSTTWSPGSGCRGTSPACSWRSPSARRSTTSSGRSGWVGGTYAPPPGADFHVGVPLPTLGFLKGFAGALQYLPIAIPFALLTVVGGINVTESARVAGDDFKTRDILLTEAVATLIAGMCGGVAQSTPYIGQPAYKSMGARAGYTLLTGLFVGLGGIFGYVSYIVELIPRAVLAPILIFVALDIMVQAFLACPARHAPAVAFAYFPTVARLLAIKLGDLRSRRRSSAGCWSRPGKELPEMLVTVALGNGFILTAMLWGAFLAEMIDRRLRLSALYLGILSVFTFFGVIHSSSPDGNMYLPWTLDRPGPGGAVPVRPRLRGLRGAPAAPLVLAGEQGAAGRRPRPPRSGVRTSTVNS